MNVSANPLVDTAFLLKAFSMSCWNKIEISRKVKAIRCYKTTLTQDLVFSMYQAARYRLTPVKIFESLSEKTNGSDLEILVETKKGFIHFPCQAKIIDKKERYPKLNHKNKHGKQIDTLITYAADNSAYPIYLFYNFCGSEFLIINESVPEFWGATVGSAFLLKQYLSKTTKTSPTFNELHPSICFPMFHLASIAAFKGQQSFAKFFGIKPSYNIVYRKPDEVLNDKRWKDLKPSAGLGYVNPFDVNIKPKQNRDANDIFFKPRFRIAFPLKQPSGRSLQFLD